MVAVASLHYSFATAAGADHTPSGMKPATVAALLPSDASTCAITIFLAPCTQSAGHKLLANSSEDACFLLATARGATGT